MADKLCPPTKAGGVKDGIITGAEHKNFSTPNTAYGRYFGSGKDSSDAINPETIMGK